MIRVLDVITTPQGASRLLEARVRGVVADPGFENAIACPEDGRFTGGLEAEGIRFFPLAMDRGMGPLGALREVASLVRILREYRPDIVHSHTSKAGAVARVACAAYNAGRRRRAVSIYQVHSFYFNAFEGAKRRAFLALERSLSRLTDVMLFQNDSELEQARAAGMGARASLIRVGNGVDLAEFPPAAAGRRHPGPGEPFVLACVARVEPKKNHRMLLEALRILRGDLGRTGARLVCVGEIGDEGVVDEARAMGLGGAAEFLGMRPRAEVASILDRAHAAVLSSFAEGKPRALMEAQLRGLPCVATRVVGTDEVVRDGTDGFLVPVGDARAMAEALDALIRDPGLYESFSARALERSRLEYDEARVVSRLKEIYAAAMEEGR